MSNTNYAVKALKGIRCRAGLCFDKEGSVVSNPTPVALQQLQDDPHLQVTKIAGSAGEEPATAPVKGKITSQKPAKVKQAKSSKKAPVGAPSADEVIDKPGAVDTPKDTKG